MTKVRQKERTDRAVCRDCGAEPVIAGHLRGEACAAKNLARTNAWREKTLPYRLAAKLDGVAATLGGRADFAHVLERVQAAAEELCAIAKSLKGAA
jgi:hypothetical protein